MAAHENAWWRWVICILCKLLFLVFLLVVTSNMRFLFILLMPDDRLSYLMF